MSASVYTEDEVRDIARDTLGFSDCEDAKCGVGQLTSFAHLGFNGVSGRPDGWYLPNNVSSPAIILEVKSEKTQLKQIHIDELQKNMNIISSKYKKCIGILYNYHDVKAFVDGAEIEVQPNLQNKEYYLGLFSKNKIDTQKIYTLTKRINDCLHFDFGIKNLYHRMVFTACALVATRYGAALVKGMDFATFHRSILSTLSKSLATEKAQNTKLDVLLEVYAEIKMNSTEDQEAIDNFVSWIEDISESINSDFWNGEDVMGIFFNEFNRDKKKSESGQVFTPDHITSFMYKLIGVNKDDVVLDAACGSGAFLVKSMCNMIKEAGGVHTAKAKDIKKRQLYGIEWDREIFALACANMLIHKDGKTNITQMDSTKQIACSWIQSKPITKVLMNPPFENKYGCITIVENVLDSVKKGTKCAFIMPDKKLEKIGKTKPKRILHNHSLLKIIKLPEKLFDGVTTSIFVFDAGEPQNGKEIFSCFFKDDGLETVKNQGRQDIKDRWADIETRWLDITHKQTGDETIQWLKPNEHLSYQMPKVAFSISRKDFTKTSVDYLMFQNSVNIKKFGDLLLHDILYSSSVEIKEGKTIITISKESEKIDISKWRDFKIGDEELFPSIEKPRPRSKSKYFEGVVPFVASGNYNNGVENYVKPENNEPLDLGGCITVSPLDGSAFFQESNFLGRGGAGSSILILRNDKLNKYNAQFICTAIRIMFSKFVYNDMGTGNKLKNEIIKLPADEFGKPDWNYMESYMKELEQSKLGDTENIKGVLI
jgi:type I restriction-modification system DNA methylase subunit